MKLHWSVKRGGIIVKTYKEHLLTSSMGSCTLIDFIILFLLILWWLIHFQVRWPAMGEEIFKFKDEKPVPDKIFQYPVTDLGDEKVPIVIDNGA